MKKISAAPLTVPLLASMLAASMLLTGCGGDTKPDASPTSTPPSSPTTVAATPTPTKTSATPTAGPKTDPNIPAAARAHTPAGAEAFVRYFFAQLNVAFAAPNAELISELSIPTCKTCTAFEGAAADLATKNQHYKGDTFAVGTVGATDKSEVLVVGEQPPGAVIDVNGAVVKSRTKAQQAKFVVTVKWSTNGWRIREIRVLK